ncbi:uncharacterized protein LOC109837062 [Asparagus officinalis]|uniref:uncharacterized protein LOC109837062 n=1 Tax=Asparagus officinalis TaxID=4686 RepID=UPI00098E5027|nr:uncharacterized protein LOC109837062 [Asparagus officinalis]
MRKTIANNIKSTIPKTDNAKEFMKFVEDLLQSDSADKSIAGTLMSTLTTMKFNGSYTMHEHVTEMANTAARLRSMGMEVSESFLVWFIINSLPSEYGSWKKPGKYNGKGKKGPLKVNASSVQIHKKERKNDKCHFCKKPGNYQKDCMKRKAWFEKKGKTLDFFNDFQKQQINDQTLHEDVITDEPTIDIPHEEVALRRSQRPRKSAISDDYVVCLQESKFNLGMDKDPVSFSQAMKSHDSNKWFDAMKDELKSMEHNEVWDLVELPKGCKRVGCKWAFKTKHDSNGNIE